jgi:hypothetical protein
MRILFIAATVSCLTAQPVEVPRTFTIDAGGLVATRARIEKGDAMLKAQLAALRAEADKLLPLKPASVMDKTKVAASGDKHDYFSLAPYWWPDPAKPDGRPYIRKDGQRTPEARQGTDREAIERTCLTVRTLGLAYWFTREEKYARKAATVARVWFLDPATRMNPNMEHAQAIPGINHGRGAGVLDARWLLDLNDGLALLAGAPAWTATDAAGMKTWLTEYYRWLTTSKHGRDEAAAKNNHGSWYDVQAAGIALALGRVDEAKRLLATVPANRVARQVEPDGSQPLELARTRPFNYSSLNLEALMLLDRLGRHVGLDLWAFSTPDGRSLRAALNNMVTYVDPAIPWPKKDLDTPARGRLLPLLVEALQHGDDTRLRALWQKFGTNPSPGEHWRLWLAGIFPTAP